jgi:hypothetical protein
MSGAALTEEEKQGARHLAATLWDVDESSVVVNDRLIEALEKIDWDRVMEANRLIKTVLSLHSGYGKRAALRALMKAFGKQYLGSDDKEMLHMVRSTVGAAHRTDFQMSQMGE